MRWFRPGIVILGLSLAVFGVTPAWAQLNAQGTGLSPAGSGLQKTLKNSQGEKPAVAQPPVLPGTKGPSEAAAPTSSPADMSPTEALFDAINRGDMVAARDAMNRGGELDGRNVLGMTPLDLSVDLGRNDISFMLLSMRGDSATARAEARAGALTGARLGASGSARNEAEPEAPRAATRARVVAASSRTPADAYEEPSYSSPRYSSGNGGAPIPAAGFLGFGR